MTSEARESSWSDGQPVLFFRFTRGTRHWCYTSSDRDESFDGETYQSTAISRSAIRQGSERARRSITVTLPSDLEVAANWRPYPSPAPVSVTCFTRHVGSPDVIADWVGRVTAPAFRGSTLELTCEPTHSTAQRLGRQRSWQRGCGLTLYSCGVDKSVHAVPAVLTAVDRLNLTAIEFGALPNRRLAGGYIEWPLPDGLIEYRSIRDHSGSVITVDYGAQDLAAGLSIVAYPGCAHTWADCGYFGNQSNYGGDLYIPLKNPYSGDPVW